MTPAELDRLMRAGETLAVEFKGEERQPFSDTDLADAVVCLANRPGPEPGWLLVGGEDDGRVTGTRARHSGAMVQQFVEKHGSISRAEVVELCRLTPPQAYRLLQRLAKTRVLQRSGARVRSVRYR